MTTSLIRLTQEVCNVEACRARLPDSREVFCALVSIARIDQLSLSEHEQLVKQGDNIAAGLVNGEDYGTIVVLGEGDQAGDHA